MAISAPSRPRPAGRRAASPIGVAAVYTRISKDDEDDRKGVMRQEDDCRAVCEGRGYPPDRIHVYEDDDRSAYSGKPRPKYQQLLKDIEAGEVDLLVAWHPDRLHRSPTELEDFIKKIQVAGIEIETARAGYLDLSTPSGRMVARHHGVAASYESEQKADRIRRKHQQMAEDGEVSGGGSRPYGYDDDRRALNAREAEHVRDAAARVLRGESLRSVCRDFTARRVSTVKGASWTPQVLRRVLISARISGRREHGRDGRGLGEITAVGKWEPIIAVEDSDALRRLLSDPARRVTSPWNQRTYLLRGIVRCGSGRDVNGKPCDKPLVSRPTVGRRSYICASGPPAYGCGGVRVDADYLEHDVIERLLTAVDEGELAAVLSAAGGDVVVRSRAEVVECEKELNELAAQKARHDITLGEWATQRPILYARLVDAERRYDAVRGSQSLTRLPRPLRPALERFDFGAKRATVQDIISEVRVGPAVRGRNRYDADRVSVTWRV